MVYDPEIVEVGLFGGAGTPKHGLGLGRFSHGPNHDAVFHGISVSRPVWSHCGGGPVWRNVGPSVQGSIRPWSLSERCRRRDRAGLESAP